MSPTSRLSLSTLLAPFFRPVRSARADRAVTAPVSRDDDAQGAAPGVRPASSAGGSTRVPAPGGAGTSKGGARADTAAPRAEGLPVTLGGAPARQVDGTTCGSAALVMLAATGDPALAGWLLHGSLPDARPPEIPPEIPSDGVGPAGRFAAAQRHVKARTSRRGLGLLPWPGALGTPPWTAAREARFPGVRYRSLPVDDASSRARAVLASVYGATLAGAPVPLYVGDDLRRGPARAVPRHVVLAVPPPADVPHRGHDESGQPLLHLYDPSSARVYPVRVHELLARQEPHRALGGWTHVNWVVLPEPVSGHVSGAG
ncbi:hypothetical protein [Georgenia sp. AZ-5]|uniref:hypothetical protein n=1 Tax=Georgenia sp. AZ-5 TaxID=3367526 RepID=UPI003754064F